MKVGGIGFRFQWGGGRRRVHRFHSLDQNCSFLVPPTTVLYFPLPLFSGRRAAFSSPPLPPRASRTPTPWPPLSTPGLRLLVNRLYSRSLVIKSRVRSCILSHHTAFSAAFSAAVRSVSAADVDAARPQHLLRGLARDALPAHALYLYLRLAAAGDPSLRPDNFTYSFAVSAFFAGGGSPIPVINGFQGDATKLFDGMSERDTAAVLFA